MVKQRCLNRVNIVLRSAMSLGPIFFRNLAFIIPPAMRVIEFKANVGLLGEADPERTRLNIA